MYMSIEKDPCGILGESVADSKGGYIHKCGSFVVGKNVYLTVTGTGPNGAGSGEVLRVVQPCCPKCGIEPAAHGTIDYKDTIEPQENRILRGL